MRAIHLHEVEPHMMSLHHRFITLEHFHILCICTRESTQLKSDQMSQGPREPYLTLVGPQGPSMIIQTSHTLATENTKLKPMQL